MSCTKSKVLHRTVCVFTFCVPGSIFATLPRTQRGIPLVIKGDPKGKNILYCNGNSVVIRDIAVSLVAVLGSFSLTVLLLESGNIRCLHSAFSPSFSGCICTLRILHSFRRSLYFKVYYMHF